MRTHPPRTRSRRRALAVVAGALGAVLPWLPGCGAGGGRPTGELRGPTAGLVAVAPEDVTGVEVRVWTYDPLGAPLAGVLAPYALGLGELGGVGEASSGLSPSGLDSVDTGPWRDHGFRLVEIPVGLVSELEAALPHIDAVRRVWLGQPTRWSELTTRVLPSDGGALGGRPVRVRAGLRVRSWIEPGLRSRPIRLDLAVVGTPLDGSGSGPMVMRDLLLTHRLAPGIALAIVPAAPDEVWMMPGEEPAGDDGAESPEQAGPPRPEDGESHAARPPAVGVLEPEEPTRESAVPEAEGPMAALPRSLGESMLIEPERIRSMRPRPSREVLVIVPSSR